DLERDRAPQRDLGRLIDDRHAPPRELALDLILAGEHAPDAREQLVGVLRLQNHGSRFGVHDLESAVAAESRPLRNGGAALKAFHGWTRIRWASVGKVSVKMEATTRIVSVSLPRSLA